MNHQKVVFAVSLEESGCEVQDLEHLFSFYPSAGACSELFHLYVAETNLPAVGGIFGVADEGENIQLHLFDYVKSNITRQRTFKKCPCHYGITMAGSTQQNDNKSEEVGR
jgi:hypothetical protein